MNCKCSCTFSVKSLDGRGDMPVLSVFFNKLGERIWAHGLVESVPMPFDTIDCIVSGRADVEAYAPFADSLDPMVAGTLRNLSAFPGLTKRASFLVQAFLEGLDARPLTPPISPAGGDRTLETLDTAIAFLEPRGDLKCLECPHLKPKCQKHLDDHFASVGHINRLRGRLGLSERIKRGSPEQGNSVQPLTCKVCKKTFRSAISAVTHRCEEF